MQPACLRLALVFTALLCSFPASAETEPRRVVVVVWDGMRPDFISHKLTPTLDGLAQRGVFFEHHHSVYISATDVNATAIATGAYPEHSGVIGNRMYRPELNDRTPITIAVTSNILAGDALTDGNYFLRPTLVEALHAAGLRTAVAGSKQVGLLHDRRPLTNGLDAGVVFEGNALPKVFKTNLLRRIGKFPPEGDKKRLPNNERDKWTRRAVTKSLWADGVPAFTLLWLGEPDQSQHATGPGSLRSLAAIRSSDDQLAAILDELDKRKLRDTTDVFVVSDHGFSTISKTVDVWARLKKAGFRAFREFTNAPPKLGDVLVVGQGGSDMFYVIGHEPGVTKRLVEWLQHQEFAGTMFTRETLEGTFPLSAANINCTNAPDVVMSMRWTSQPSKTGAPGMFFSDGSEAGKGNHASLSRFDLHNTLVAAGPDFKKGVRSPLPSGNTDLAPTILHLLGVKPLAPMDGRVLGEALAIPAPPVTAATTNRMEATRSFQDANWSQYLQISRVNDTIYLDEGNGGQSGEK